MYARLVTIQVQPGKIDEAIRYLSRFHRGGRQAAEGVKSALLLTDQATGKGTSVTLWETEADLTASETSGYFQQQIVKFGGILSGPPTREHFVVSVQG